MATIQVRDIPDEAYETIRRRARAAGQSIQAYMRIEIERLAREPTDSELFSEIERHIAHDGIALDQATLQADIDSGRS